MTNDTKYLCTECAALYLDNGFLVSARPRGIITGKCAKCQKVKAVSGVLDAAAGRKGG